MKETPVTISISDGVAEAFLYTPDDEPHPGVLFYTDIGGIRDAMKGMAERMAGEGYTVLLPNIFYRTSPLPIFTLRPDFRDEKTAKRITELSQPLTPAAVEADASAYGDFLAAQPSVMNGPMGAVGYCFSGAMAVRTAAARPDKIAAAASFHGGRLYTDQPTSPHLILPRVKAHLYFGHAIEDRSMPAEAIKNFEAALRSWGGEYKSETYPGSYHSWTVPDSPVYNHEGAERAFEKLMNLFSETLK